jgi:hypothetical protein
MSFALCNLTQVLFCAANGFGTTNGTFWLATEDRYIAQNITVYGNASHYIYGSPNGTYYHSSGAPLDYMSWVAPGAGVLTDTHLEVFSFFTVVAQVVRLIVRFTTPTETTSVFFDQSYTPVDLFFDENRTVQGLYVRGGLYYTKAGPIDPFLLVGDASTTVPIRGTGRLVARTSASDVVCNLTCPTSTTIVVDTGASQSTSADVASQSKSANVASQSTATTVVVVQLISVLWRDLVYSPLQDGPVVIDGRFVIPDGAALRVAIDASLVGQGDVLTLFNFTSVSGSFASLQLDTLSSCILLDGRLEPAADSISLVITSSVAVCGAVPMNGFY